MIRQILGWLCGYLLLLALAALGVRLYITHQYLSGYDEADQALIKAVDRDGEFLGRGLTVKFADNKWGWLLPDLNSLAQKTGEKYLTSVNGASPLFQRSYEIQGNVGFVWSWRQPDRQFDTYLIYLFHGHNGVSRSLVNPLIEMTMDEVIAVAYFSSLFDWPDDEPVAWQLSYPNDDYLPEALGFIGDELFRRSEFDLRFAGRISSVLWERLEQKDGNFRICRRHYDNCVVLPTSFTVKIKQSDLKFNNAELAKYYTSIKFKFGQHGEIGEVISMAVLDGDFVFDANVEGGERTKLEGIYRLFWPLPEGQLGAGSVPFFVDEAEFEG